MTIVPAHRRLAVFRGRSEGTAARPAERFAPFDGLRAIAALLVFMTHMNEWRFPGGWIGVELFFALSGYLITSLLLAEWQRTRRIDLKAFYVRRTLRLAPALVVLVVVVTAVGFIQGVDGTVADSLAAITYTMDIYAPSTGGLGGALGHTWTLAIEEQFYLIWPVVLLFALRRAGGLRRTAVALAGVAAVAATAGGVLAAVAGTDTAYETPMPHLPVLLAGVGLALVARHRRRWLQGLHGWWAPTVAVTAGAAYLFTANHAQLWLYFGGAAALAVPCVLLLGHLVVRPNGLAARALQLRPLLWLGKRSYGFYLWHRPVIDMLGLASLPAWVPSSAAALVPTLVLTMASWWFVETPALRLKQRWAVRPEPVRLSALAQKRWCWSAEQDSSSYSLN